MIRIISLALIAALFTPSLAAISAADTDPFIGKWKLDVRHSKYPEGTCPKSMFIEMEPAERGIWYHSDAVYNNGAQTHTQYTAPYTGREVVVMSGGGMMLPVSLKREDLRVVVASYMRGMQVVATSRRVVSADGRRMTITTDSMDKSGRKVTTVGVYTRE